MKKRIKGAARILVAAIIVLTGCLPLPTRSGRFSPSARAAAAKPAAALSTSQGDQAVQQLKQQGLYDSLEEAVAAARYELRWEDQPALGGLPAAYHASNPAQRLSAYFTPAELHLAPHKKSKDAGTDGQTSKQAEWRATMKLIGHGYGDNLVAAGAAEIAARGHRIEYRREWPPLTEWYVNKAGGLEQGFTLAAPPGARGEGDRLRVALELTGDLRPELAEGGQAIALKQADGELALRYSNLFATDANGRALPSQMKLSERNVILEVDDVNAVYPVTIDPTFTQQQILNASDGAGDDYFGSSVAMTGDTVVVGAPFDDILSNANRGSAYVFVRSGTSWSQQAKLLADDGVANDGFGSSVALSGSMVNGVPTLTVVVGAKYRTEGSNMWQGAAYVFVRSGTSATWIQQQKLIGPGTGDAWDRFGSSVAIDGDTMLIGSPEDDVGSNTYQGSVHIYIRSNGMWNWNQMLLASDGAGYDDFGASIALNGSTGRLLVGAPGADIGSNAGQGAAYVFVRSGTTWSEQSKLTANDGAAGDLFGSAVAIESGRLVVGAPFDDIGANQSQGSAYVFVLSGSTWSQQQKLIAADGVAYDYFGGSVAITSNFSMRLVVVGVPDDDIGANADQGSAYAFTQNFNSTTWSQQPKLTATSGGAGDRFGQAVAVPPVSAQYVAVGAPSDDIGANREQGSAYVFLIN